ncbi:MAG TPA: DUF2619 domain-containing protein [Firmicutes bacterium]|nr:DUF2619 domain-containing protein [Bacillota bacterium]
MAEENKVVAAMACLRAAGALVEILGALLMLKCSRVSAALRINAVLGLLGPAVVALVCALGLSGIAGRVSWVKMFIILCGSMLIVAATR